MVEGGGARGAPRIEEGVGGGGGGIGGGGEGGGEGVDGGLRGGRARAAISDGGKLSGILQETGGNPPVENSALAKIKI